MSPSGDRNARPPAWSPLWCYVWGVVAAATAVSIVALAGLHPHDISLLAGSAAFWLVAAPLGVAAVGPIVPGNSRDGGYAFVVFLFAVLLHVGLAAAVALCIVTILVREALSRHALHRGLFNAGQHMLTLVATWAVLRAFSIDPTPAHPWSFSEPAIRPGELLAVALAGLVFLVVNNGTVYIALSLVESRSLLKIIRDDRRHLAVVGAAMVSLSPLVLVVMVHLWPFLPLFYPALVSLYYSVNVSAAREHEALHDPLTGVGNRSLLHRQGAKVVDELPRDDGAAILVLDLDNFKEVNDTLGHAAGDHLLCIVAERLAAGLRSDDIVARLGGDEFVVVVRDVPDVTVARIAAVRVLERVVGPCVVDDVTVTVSASVGVAVAPAHGHEFDVLLRRADRAMYIAKASGCGVAIFDPAGDDDWRRPPVVLTDQQV